MLFIYSGPHQSVNIPSLDRTVAKGQEFEATGEDAKALLDQPDNFTRTDKKEN